MEEHDCKVMGNVWNTAVEEVESFPCYGPVIHSIVKEAGVWVAHNGEYASRIKFCPFCGQKLE